MATTFSIVPLVLLVTFLAVSNAQPTVFDITKNGAVADGKTDIAAVITKTWAEACASPTPAKLLIPTGSYFSSYVEFKGPCKAPIEAEIQGNLMAPGELPGDTWIAFRYIDNLHVFGNGILDAQGPLSWRMQHQYLMSFFSLLKSIRFDFDNNGLVEGLTSKDAKQFHIEVFGSKNYTLSNLKIQAPSDSPNTDGIHIGKSTQVTIQNSIIGTGDDCVSIGDAVEQVTVTNVTCGPGHGISIGSLGKYPDEKSVKGVIVKNCTLVETDNGLRIKSWPDLYPGEASDVHFEDIIMNNVNNPIIIDQTYCPGHTCGANRIASKVKISNVVFKNIKGTSKNPEAVFMNCSQLIPCDNIQMTDIDLTYPKGVAKSKCFNVKPIVSGVCNPPACTVTS
ncbi:G9 [Linum grandiflorum]